MTPTKPTRTSRAAPFGKAGTELWEAIIGTFDLAAHETVLVRSACAHADMIARLEALLEDDLTTTGSTGQTRLNSAVGELRQCRLALSRLLTDLALPLDEVAESAPLLSPTQRRAQKAAKARHDRDRLRHARAAQAEETA